MSKKENPTPMEEQETPMEEQETPMEQETVEAENSETSDEETFTLTREQMEKMEALAGQMAALNDQHLRLAAEYDNYRKRTAKEKEQTWTEAKAQTVAAFLPVYDNLERALKQATTDEAYAKGVDMTMKGLQDALAKLGVEVIPALGETFDPNLHNAVMHVDDESVEDNTIVDVFQQGFKCGEKVIRFAMVKVAN